MKAKLINEQIVRGLPKFYTTADKTYVGDFDKQSDTVHAAEGFFPIVEPTYDIDTQKVGEMYFDEVNQVFTKPVIDKTQEELQAEIDARIEALDNEFDQQAAKRLLRKVAEPILADEANLTEQDIEDAKMLYNQWRWKDKNGNPIEYKADDKVVYNEALYKVIQAHTSQADWTPDVSGSLFTQYRVPGTIEPWVQPESTNPYMAGDKVTHNSKTWVSDVDDNVWEPGVYGWSEV